MKRIIAALSFTLLAAPVLAADIGLPFEQTQLDRALPNVQNPVVTDSASSGSTLLGTDVGAPYEETVTDMALPNVKDPVIAGQRTQVAGPAFSDGSARADQWARNYDDQWAGDHHFIAPPQ